MLIAVWMDRDGTLDTISYSDMASLNEAMLNGDWAGLPDNIIKLNDKGSVMREFILQIEELDVSC